MTGYVASGSNLGDRGAHLRAAIEGLRRAGIRVAEQSSVWETEPAGIENAGPFWNMALRIESGLEPHDVLAILHAVERDRGRRRDGRPRSRTLDLDLLLLGNRSVSDDILRLPHPRMWQRSFVLAPLNEIAPGLRDPETGRTVAEALAAIPSPTAVRNVGPLDRRSNVLI